MWSRFEGVIHAHSAKAIFFQSWYWEEGLWLPKSQVRMFEDGESDYVIDVRDWLAEKNGLMEFTPYTAQQIGQIHG